MQHKYEEIKEHATDLIKEGLAYDKEYLDKDISDIHHDLFNTYYYIIGTYKAKEWLSNEVFNVIEEIKEYEENNFGEVTTDFSSPEQVVNMYVYIIGEKLLYEDNILDEFNEILNNKG